MTTFETILNLNNLNILAMLIEVDAKTYNNIFPANPNPFVSELFIELNREKTSKVVRLIDESGEPVIGLIAGIKDEVIRSPFSAPFGGFHFKKENIYISEIDRFVSLLQSYAVSNQLKRIEITTPPDIYHSTFNAKVINSLIRCNYTFAVPEITNWVDLEQFKDSFSQRNSKEYYRQAIRNKLSFNLTKDNGDIRQIYDLVSANRARFGRPIYMTLKDIIDTEACWPVDFFKVNSSDGLIVASAIFYRNYPQICYAVFWGDNDNGRPLRAMDFLAFNLYAYYKGLGFKYIDLGISTESGSPNEGLLRFKESHEATSSLRYKFIWET
jgi:hypothetical protein